MTGVVLCWENVFTSEVIPTHKIPIVKKVAKRTKCVQSIGYKSREIDTASAQKVVPHTRGLSTEDIDKRVAFDIFKFHW